MLRAAGDRGFDWELSTLGDPMADFTYLLTIDHAGLATADLTALNIPSL
jgi:aminoglycoside phosphotransferase (APT) family kinase protein